MVKTRRSSEKSNEAPKKKPKEGEGNTCMICCQSFKSEDKLKVHLRSHTGESPFECTICEKGFTQKAALKVHIRTHTGERPFACEECDKTFARADHLSQHIRTHTGEKPYKCKLCNKAFATWSAISRHKAEHLSRDHYSCQVCSRTFSRLSNLKSHVSKVHSHSGSSDESSSPVKNEAGGEEHTTQDLLETLEDGEHFLTSGLIKREVIVDEI